MITTNPQQEKKFKEHSHPQEDKGSHEDAEVMHTAYVIEAYLLLRVDYTNVTELTHNLNEL
jgi:hypothetical protein